MKRRLLLVALVAACAALAGSCGAIREAAPSETVVVTVLHINDPHGSLEPRVTLAGKNVGGYARLSTMVREERAAGAAARVILVHAGDELSRGDELTRATLGAANFAVLNFLKFDLWVPGNGDYYDGAENLLARVRQAQFPTLAANVKVAATGEQVGRPHVIEQAGPVRLAFLGLCFVSPKDPESFRQFACEDGVAAAARMVPELRRQADAVIVVSHMGLRTDERLARTVPGIDVIVGAHSHSELPTGIRVKDPQGNEVLICQAGAQLEYLGKLSLTVGRFGVAWRVVAKSDRLVPIDDKVKLDPAVTALIAREARQAGRRPPASPPAETLAPAAQ
jgi:2',3'-cyclic-nucleotide 2'-phosphodiesterase (5'-nucleotidase family)